MRRYAAFLKKRNQTLATQGVGNSTGAKRRLVANREMVLDVYKKTHGQNHRKKNQGGLCLFYRRDRQLIRKCRKDNVGDG